MCCLFSPGSDSLSSAATSVVAKPNHGFFHCQHPCRIFFPRFPADGRRASGPGNWRNRRAQARAHAHRKACMRKKCIKQGVFDDQRAGAPAPTRPCAPRERGSTADAREVYEDCLRRCLQHRDQGVLQARLPRSARKKRVAPVFRNDALGRRGMVAKRSVSGRRLRSARHSRPDRAAR